MSETTPESAPRTDEGKSTTDWRFYDDKEAQRSREDSAKAEKPHSPYYSEVFDELEAELGRWPFDDEVHSRMQEKTVTARGVYAKLSVKQGKRLLRGGQSGELYKVAKDDYENMLKEQIALGLSLGDITQDEQVTEYIAELVVEEKRALSAEQTEILSKQKFQKFLKWYHERSRLQKIGLGVGVGVGVGLAASSLGAIAGGGAAVGGAVGGAGARFGRGYINSLNPSGHIGSTKGAEQFAARVSKQKAAQQIEMLFKSTEEEIEANLKANRKAVARGIGMVALGGLLGEAADEMIDHFASQSADALAGVDTAPSSNAFTVNTIEVSPDDTQIPGMDSIGAEETVAAEPDVGDAPISAEDTATPEVDTGAENDMVDSRPEVAEADTTVEEFEPFTDTVEHGDGFTHVIRDLAKAEGYELKPGQLYELYKENETAFASFVDTQEAYVMPNGDYGISNPGQITINAELREQLVEGMREKLGLPPLEDVPSEIGDALTIEADESSAGGVDAAAESTAAEDVAATEPNTESAADLADPSETAPESATTTSEAASEAQDPAAGEPSTEAVEPEIGSETTIEWADDVDARISDLDLTRSPITNARSLAPSPTMNQLLEQALNIYANNNGIAEYEIVLDNYGLANTVLFDGVSWQTNSYADINQILKTLAQTR